MHTTENLFNTLKLYTCLHHSFVVISIGFENRYGTEYRIILDAKTTFREQKLFEVKVKEYNHKMVMDATPTNVGIQYIIETNPS